jgi:hypothetical protein
MTSANARLWRDARLNAGKAGGVAVAKRYSGDVVVTMIYRDATRDYACRVAIPGETRVVFVGAPKALEHAVDSREAFDQTARAAIAFAEDEGCLACNAEYDEALTHVKVTGKPPVRRSP